MMRTALQKLGSHSENTVMIGDRMDTDIVAGIEAGLETILVLSGVTNREDVARYPYLPSKICTSIREVLEVEFLTRKKNNKHAESAKPRAEKAKADMSEKEKRAVK
jgi:ribonucleotide monophosphatase NagD (HAD superfamily)